MDALLITQLLLCHIAASVPFWRRLSRGLIPLSIDFCCCGFLLFYDVGLVCELLGAWYPAWFFHPFLESDEPTLLWAIALLSAAPWLMRAGAALVNPSPVALPVESKSRLDPSRRWGFYLLSFIPLAVLAGVGLWLIRSGAPMWQLKAGVTQELGCLIIVLSLPMHFLTFYVRQRDSWSFSGLLYTMWILAASVLANAPTGKRNSILMPLLVICLFRTRLNVWRLATAAVVGIVAASVLLTVFKSQHAGDQESLSELVVATVNVDLARAPVLADVIEKSSAVGTDVLPYVGSGYVYSALFFVPRALVPSKGYSTSRIYTSDIEGSSPDETTWGLAVGAVEEAVLNVGLLLAFPALVLLGCGLGLLDKFTARNPSLVVGARLGALSMVGYHLPVLLSWVLIMATNWLMQRMFARDVTAAKA